MSYTNRSLIRLRPDTLMSMIQTLAALPLAALYESWQALLTRQEPKSQTEAAAQTT